MKSNEVFPSEFLKAADFTKPALLTMANVEMRDLGDDHKPVLFFKEMDKGLVLNRTNWSTIAEAYNDDSDEWDGKQIVLYVDENVRFQGKRTPAIRCRKPKMTRVEVVPKAEPMETNRTDMDDDIPF